MNVNEKVTFPMQNRMETSKAEGQLLFKRPSFEDQTITISFHFIFPTYRSR